MAFYDGETLKQRLAAAPLPVAEALDIATQVADGLARAHAAGVVHRDIKPGNVMLTEDAVKIVDFGLATLAGSVQLTQAGSPMGTVAYMSPEQLRGARGHAAERRVGRRRDAVRDAERATRRSRAPTPRPSPTPSATRRRRRCASARPEIPEEVEQLVFRALHKDPACASRAAASSRARCGRCRGRRFRSTCRRRSTCRGSSGRVAAPARRHGRAIAGGVAAAGAARGRRLAAWYADAAAVVRTFVAVAPVANGTGDRTLDPYRLGLTLALTRELARVESTSGCCPITRCCSRSRRFLLERRDVSSADAVRAVCAASGAAVVVVPTLLYDRGAWKARAELQDC